MLTEKYQLRKCEWMVSNLEKFKQDIDKLIKLGDFLHIAMQYELRNELQKDALKNNDAKNLIKELPDFSTKYESWYSESVVLLKQILPDRLSHFVSFYEKSKNRKAIDSGNYTIQDYLQGITITRGWDKEVLVNQSAALPKFRQQLNIIKASKSRFESTLFDIKQLVQADLFDSEIKAAQELLKYKFFRAAGAVTGVVIEKHLIEVCNSHNIQITKKNSGIADLNELLKANQVIDMPQWRRISLLADIRNLYTHNKKDEPKEEDVKDLIDGAIKILKTVF